MTVDTQDDVDRRRRLLRCVAALLTLALGLRVAAAVLVDRKVTADGRQFLIEGDANGYWELAGRIAAGEEYAIYTPPRRVLRTPGFPLLLAACRVVLGDSIFAASLVMAIIGTGCCALTWLLARRLFDDRTALVALWLTAIAPIQIGSNVQILSETWFSFWLLLCLLALQPLVETLAGYSRARRREGAAQSSAKILRRAFCCGLLTGLATLVRPGWILWTGFSAVLVLASSRQRRTGLLAATLIVVGCFVALLPWAWRNHTVSGHWVFTSLWSGPSLYDGLHPGATGASDMTFVDTEDVYATMNEYDANEHYKARAIEFARQNPRRAIELAFIKAGRYLSPTLNASGFSGGPFSLVCLVWYGTFAILVVAGNVHMPDRRAMLGLLTGPFLQFLLVHMVFVGSIRYRLPVEFPLSIVAAHGLVAMVGRIRSRAAHELPARGE